MHISRSVLALSILIAVFPLAALAAPSPSVTAGIAAPTTNTFTRLDSITFTGADSKTNCPGPFLKFTWDFGDGTPVQTVTSSTSSLTHTFASLGGFVVSHTASAKCGTTSTFTSTVTRTIHIVNLAPTAALSVPSSAEAGTLVVWDTSGSYDPDGDGIAARSLDGVTVGATDTQTYSIVGDVTRSLVVTDGAGAASAAVTATVTIVPGPIATVTVSGPSTLIAGEEGTYTATGRDAFGNVRGTSTFVFSSTTAGSQSACGTFEEVEGCLDVLVGPAALASVEVTGPIVLTAGETGDYTITGYDAFGNEAGSDSFAFSTTLAGPAEACGEFGGMTDCLAVTVVPAAVDHVVVTPGAVVLNLGWTATFTAVAYDAFDNVVNSPVVWSSSLGTIHASGVFSSLEVGDGNVTATVEGVEGKAPVRVTHLMLVSVAASSTVGGKASGSGHVDYSSDGSPAAGVPVTVRISRAFGPVLLVRTIHVVTDSDGDFAFASDFTTGLPGEYSVTAFATDGRNYGSVGATYHPVSALVVATHAGATNDCSTPISAACTAGDDILVEGDTDGNASVPDGAVPFAYTQTATAAAGFIADGAQGGDVEFAIHIAFGDTGSSAGASASEGPNVILP